MMRFRGDEDVNTWDIWVARRITAEIRERVVCSMIMGGLCGAGLVGWQTRRYEYHDLMISCRL